MGQTCVAWLEDEDRSGAAVGLAAVSDPDMIITSGDNLRIRKDVPLVAMMYAVTEFAAYAVNNIRISSPSIASNPIRITKGVALNYTSPELIYDFREAPIHIAKVGDNVTAYGYEEDEAGISHYLGCVLILSDGWITKERPPGSPAITHIHRCTVGAATEAAWSALALTQTDDLPAGEYDMWGARVESATAVAARFIFKGMDLRPAVIPVTRSQDPVHPFSQYWGAPIRFTMPDGLPTLDILACAAETPGDVELYLTKV